MKSSSVDRTGTLPIYYINLDGSDARRAMVEEQLKNAGVTHFVRVPAFDGRQLDPNAFDDYDSSAAQSYMGRPMPGGEYGCYKSHLKCLELIQNSDDDFAVVLEDDAILNEAFISTIADVVQALNSSSLRWDVVNLAPARLSYYTRCCVVGRGASLVSAHFFPMLTSALLWSRQGARDFLKNHSTVTQGFDHQVREAMVRSDRGFAVWPPIARQSGIASDIDGPIDARRIRRTWFFNWVTKSRRRLVMKSMAVLHSIQFRLVRRHKFRAAPSV